MRWQVWAPVAAVIGITAVIAVVVVPLALRRDTPDRVPIGEPAPQTTSTPPGWLLPADGGRGVPVQGIGTLIREANQTVRFCAEVMVQLSLPPAGAGCSPVFVTATGVEDRWFTESATSGQRWSVSVKVEGTYRAGTLAVSRIEPVTPAFAPMAEPPVPCDPPAGGWPLGYGLPEGDTTSQNHFIEYVRAHPDRFSDVWEAHPDGKPSPEASYMPTRMVYVVGTYGDLAQARADLAREYRGNLCVVKVKYTAADLDNIANRLRSVNSTPIDASPMVIENKVRVKVVALDPPTVAILDAADREALVIEEPLLQWLD